MNSVIAPEHEDELLDVVETEAEMRASADKLAATAWHFSYKHPFAPDFCLRDLTFEVRVGEVVALIGESGSGKTTLIDCLTAFNPHFYRGGLIEGHLFFLGEDIAECDILKLARRYGRVSQDPRTQLFAQQVEDAIAFPMENKGMDRQEMARRMDAMLAMLRVEHIREREATTLSGGEGQAVVIASMLVKDPEVMFFDDITSALDPRGQALVKGIIASLKSESRTIFVVDPDFDWLATVADRVLLLDHGRLAFNGSPQELLARRDLMLLAGIIRPEIKRRPLPPGEVAIQVQGLSYAYEDNLAVNDVSFSVQRGAVTGIVGHNGSGKSTLAKLLAGLLRPKAGEILVEGRPITGLKAPEMVRRVGYLYQQPSRMFFNKTVADELAFTPLALGLEQRITLEEFGLECLPDATPYDLSAGQRQRLAMACVLSADPAIVILDEPTQGLNQQGRAELALLIQRLQQEGKTVLLISHDMYLVANATEDLVVMDHGRVVRQGPSIALLQDGPFFAGLGLPLPWE